jgi:hypothetical protein
LEQRLPSTLVAATTAVRYCMSDPGSPASIIQRAAEPVLADLRGHGEGGREHGAYPAAADVLERSLHDGTLSGHLTPKSLATLASELLDSLPAVQPADHAD